MSVADSPEPKKAAGTRPKGPARCEYAHFDPRTLEPLNEATLRRAIEVSFQREDFEGRTVLDIGCHSGFMSFLAARAGARHVQAYDVQAAFIEDLHAAVAVNGLPVEGALRPFAKLDPTHDAADVVLFFEVIHWLVAQGIPVAEVISKLAELTGQLLFMEFPWDVSEPSIEAQTSLTRAEYDSALILRELTKHFESVEIKRFMSYFGTDGRSVRALARASKRKMSSFVLPYAPGLTGLERKLDWSRGNSTFLHGSPTSYVAKVPATESALRRVDAELVTRLFDELSEAAPSVLLLPIKLGSGYSLRGACSEPFYVSPWVGPAPLGDRPDRYVSTEKMIDLSTDVARELSAVSPALIAALRASAFRREVTQEGVRQYLTQAAAKIHIDAASWSPWWDAIETLTDDDYAVMCHGDLNSSNIVGAADEPRVVDFDNLMLGSPYTDIGAVLATRGASADEIHEALLLMSRRLGIIAPTRTDLVFSLHQTLGWLAVTVPMLGSASGGLERLIDLRVRGLSSLVELGARLPVR